MKKIFACALVFAFAFGVINPQTALARPRCVLGNPILNIWFYSTPLDPGQAGSIMTKIGNGDSDFCFGSFFKLSVNMPNRWHPTVQSGHTVFIPATGDSSLFERKQINFKVPANAEQRDYQFVVTVKNLITQKKTRQTVTIRVGGTPVIESMTPVSGPVGTRITLTGRNFGPMPELSFQDNEHGHFYVRGVPSNGSTFSFNVPATMSMYSCGCHEPSVPATYNVSIGNNGTYSNIVQFNLIE